MEDAFKQSSSYMRNAIMLLSAPSKVYEDTRQAVLDASRIEYCKKQAGIETDTNRSSFDTNSIANCCFFVYDKYGLITTRLFADLTLL